MHYSDNLQLFGLWRFQVQQKKTDHESENKSQESGSVEIFHSQSQREKPIRWNWDQLHFLKRATSTFNVLDVDVVVVVEVVSELAEFFPSSGSSFAIRVRLLVPKPSRETERESWDSKRQERKKKLSCVHLSLTRSRNSTQLKWTPANVEILDPVHLLPNQLLRLVFTNRAF